MMCKLLNIVRIFLSSKKHINVFIIKTYHHFHSIIFCFQTELKLNCSLYFKICRLLCHWHLINIRKLSIIHQNYFPFIGKGMTFYIVIVIVVWVQKVLINPLKLVWDDSRHYCIELKSYQYDELWLQFTKDLVI